MNRMIRPEPETRPAQGGVRQSVAHESAERHVTGKAIYIDDAGEPEGCLHAWTVMSDRAHAAITGIDTAEAAAMPGVAAVVTAGDIPGRNDAGPILPGEPLLADSVVENWGQAIAVVAARTEAEARAAAARVTVGYEDRPAILTVDQALAAESHVIAPMIMRRGEAASAIAAAPHRLDGELRFGGQDHFYLESQVAMAIPGEDDAIHIHSSTQHPTEVQHVVSRLLGVPYAAVTVEVRRMGGAFGGKESQASLIAGMAAVLACKTGKPVKLRLNRDTDMIMTGKRHGGLARYSIGHDGDGRILGLDMIIALDAGSVPDLSGPVLTRALCHVDNVYYLPAVTVTGYACKTHTVSNTAFRGFGGPQGMLAMESAVMRVADALGRTPEEIRAVNGYDPIGRDTGRNLTPYGQPVRDNVLPRVMERLAEKVDVAARRREIAAFNATSPVVKKGLGVFPVKFGISFNLPTLNQAGALLHVYTDGSVHLNHGGTEMGQGLFVKVAQVVAEAFGIDIGHVRPSSTRTDKVPNTSATAASSGSDLNGMAALAAAETLRARMAAVAADAWGCSAADIVFGDNAVRSSAGDGRMRFVDLAQLCWERRVSLSATGFYATPDIHFDQGSMTGEPFYYFAYGACVAEAAIDTLTGENRILSAHIVHDVGTSLNPAIDIGQIEGAFVQGLGWLTTEELWWDGEGRLRTHAPSTYKIPTSRDVPAMSISLLDEAPNPRPTIFRSKAVGEPPFMLAIAGWLAIRDAVKNAGGKAETLTAPATGEAVLRAVTGFDAQ
ncbi:xanthine dehydrogenase molybdopterin binding subunit [Fodinicurvata sp. EGI_FJ10296]|uniref:xanthine dehydrogenase molybdopterin binding subunit n=1 Tax=Fodinicurvata sp. EGI_FJ10296 TaxID=3231908 RepID=UPI003455D1CF